MAHGFKHGGSGGGGASLNFKVVGNPQPTSPKENTIWVNTDLKITAYYFSPAQPEGMTGGEVWISTGAESDVAFNALKKNSIQVYPILAMQYIDGAWAELSTKSWQNGEWVDWYVWDGTLYDSGNQYEKETGGWVLSHDGTIKETSIHLGDETKNSNTTKYVQTVNLIDLDGYNTVEVNILSGYNGHKDKGTMSIKAIDENGAEAASAIVVSNTNSIPAGPVTLDISTVNVKCHIRIQMNWSSSSGGTYIAWVEFDKVVLK